MRTTSAGTLGGLVLAGRENHGALQAEAPEARFESQIEVGGRPMATWVAAALAGIPGLARLAVVGPSGLWPGAVEVPPRPSLVENLRAGLEALGDGLEAVLIAAGDAPLLTARAVEDLVAACRQAGADFGYPVVSRGQCEARYPGVRRTYVHLAEGHFTGGNCFFLRAAAVDTALGMMSRLYAARKHPLRLAGILGPAAVAGLVTGRAHIASLERTAETRFGLRARAFPGADPDIAVDVDKPDDLTLVRRVLSAGPGADRQGADVLGADRQG